MTYIYNENMTKHLEKILQEIPKVTIAEVNEDGSMNYFYLTKGDWLKILGEYFPEHLTQFP